MEIVIYTDGACKGNPGKGGWAFAIIRNGEVVKTQKGHVKITTNNRMEMTAVVEALTYLHIQCNNQESSISWLQQPVNLNKTLIVMKVDSQYVIKGITKWIHGWKKNNWKNSKNEDVLNKDLWEALDACTKPFPNLEWAWIKGHGNDKYNILVDKLACEGAISPII